MIYLLDTNVVAELTTRQRPDPRVVAWLRSTPRPNRFLSVITVAEIEAGVAATPDPVRQARYAKVLATARLEYRDRIAPIGEREAAAYLAVHKALKVRRNEHRPAGRPHRRHCTRQRLDRGQLQYQAPGTYWRHRNQSLGFQRIGGALSRAATPAGRGFARARVFSQILKSSNKKSPDSWSGDFLRSG